MQKTLLIGYLGKDPEMKYTPAGTAIATFTIASTERWDSAGEPQEHHRVVTKPKFHSLELLRPDDYSEWPRLRERSAALKRAETESDRKNALNEQPQSEMLSLRCSLERARTAT